MFFSFFHSCASKILNAPRNSLSDTCPQMQTLIRKTTSLLSAKAFFQKGEENFLVLLLKTRCLQEIPLNLDNFSESFRCIKEIYTPPIHSTLHRYSTALSQIFLKARQRSLPFPARIRLRQLPAPASSNPERGMQITAPGTVNKVLGRLKYN